MKKYFIRLLQILKGYFIRFESIDIKEVEDIDIKEVEDIDIKEVEDIDIKEVL